MKKTVVNVIIIAILLILEGIIPTQSVAADNTYKISNKRELIEFAELVNSGNNFEGITVILENDIDLQCDENNQWDPIGWSNATNASIENSEKATFKGVFEGNNHVISGIYSKDEKGFKGLFGVNEGTIQNVIVANSYIEIKKLYAGYIAAYNSNGTIINCKNHANIECASSSGAVGGITGYSTGGNIIGCTNYGEIKGTTGGMGGIVGYTWGNNIIKCRNYGNIQNDEYDAGGILGFGQTSWFIECLNQGKITGVVDVGGIAGQITRYSSVNFCYNTGDVQNNARKGQRLDVGGIIGYCDMVEGSSYYIKNSYNTGNISYKEMEGTEPKMGHIVGMHTKGIIENCYYLKNGSSIIGTGENKSDELGKIEGKTELELKSTQMVELLNKNITQNDIDSKTNSDYKLYNGDGKAFIVDLRGNNLGYPMLYWDMTNAKGDANFDGKIDIKDIFAINKHRLNKSQLQKEAFLLADVNKDGQVDIKDILQINKYRLGKISSL